MTDYRFVYSQAKHANGEYSWGINGDTGKVVDMKEYGLYESASVKVRSHSPSHLTWLTLSDNTQVQTLKTAIEAARVLLRVDDVVKATRKDKEQGGGGGGGAPPQEMMEG